MKVDSCVYKVYLHHRDLSVEVILVDQPALTTNTQTQLYYWSLWFFYRMQIVEEIKPVLHIIIMKRVTDEGILNAVRKVNGNEFFFDSVIHRYSHTFNWILWSSINETTLGNDKNGFNNRIEQNKFLFQTCT